MHTRHWKWIGLFGITVVMICIGSAAQAQRGEKEDKRKVDREDRRARQTRDVEREAPARPAAPGRAIGQEESDFSRRVLTLASRLELTDEQISSIKEIEIDQDLLNKAEEDVQQQSDALEDAVIAGSDAQAIANLARDLGNAFGRRALVRSEHVSKVRDVLTDEQNEKLTGLMKQVRQRSRRQQKEMRQRREQMREMLEERRTERRMEYEDRRQRSRDENEDDQEDQEGGRARGNSGSRGGRGRR